MAWRWTIDSSSASMYRAIRKDLVDDATSFEGSELSGMVIEVGRAVSCESFTGNGFGDCICATLQSQEAAKRLDVACPAWMHAVIKVEGLLFHSF